MQISFAHPKRQFVAEPVQGVAEKVRLYADLGMYRAGGHSIGAVGVILLAKHQDLIETVRPAKEYLRNSSLHYGKELLAKVLQLANKQPL